MAKSGPVDRASDRWASIVLSVLLHGAIVAAIAYSWWTYKSDRPAPTLAIEATVVDAKSVPGIGKLPPQPEPAPPPPVVPPPEPPPETQPQVEPDGPPQPTPEELAKREQEQKDQAEKEAQAKQQELDRKRADQEKQQEAVLAEEKAAQEKRDEEKRLADEQAKKVQEKADADRKAREVADAKKKADQQAEADREADLRRSLDQELRQDAARSSGALASWQSQITARIQRAWLRPASARSGIECVLNVTQVPGGEVTNVRIGTCNGDQAVRESIEAAVYRASPLPPPPDPSLFERSLVITFRPD
jgi:colicin import membrane protein